MQQNRSSDRSYWFCYAVSPETAIQEADGCLRTIRNYRIDYPVCYDIEQASAAYALGEGVTITPALAKQLVSSFCNRIEAGGYYAMFYTNRSFLDNYLGNDLAKRYAFWYARYASSFDGTDCGMWQYTNEGSVPGIGGNVDLDIGYIDYPASSAGQDLITCLKLLRRPLLPPLRHISLIRFNPVIH